MNDQSIIDFHRQISSLFSSLSTSVCSPGRPPQTTRMTGGERTIERSLPLSGGSGHPAVVDPDLLILDMRDYPDLEDAIVQVKSFLENVRDLAFERGMYDDRDVEPSLLVTIVIGSDEQDGSPSQTLRNVLQLIFRNLRITFVETATDDDELIMVVDALSGIQDDDDPPPVDTASEPFVPRNLIFPSSPSHNDDISTLHDFGDERRRLMVIDEGLTQDQDRVAPYNPSDYIESTSLWRTFSESMRSGCPGNNNFAPAMFGGPTAEPLLRPSPEEGDSENIRSGCPENDNFAPTFYVGPIAEPLSQSFHEEGNGATSASDRHSPPGVFDEEHVLLASRQSFLDEQRRRELEADEIRALVARRSVLDEERRKQEAEERYDRDLEHALEESEDIAHEEQRRLRTEEDLVHDVMARTRAAADELLKQEEDQVLRMVMKTSVAENRKAVEDNILEDLLLRDFSLHRTIPESSLLPLSDTHIR